MSGALDYPLILLAGVLGSLHCVGMCGAIVLAYSTAGGTGATQAGVVASLPSHLAYNGGRVLAYVLIGGLAGAVGGIIGSLEWVGNWFALVAGIVMTVAGLLMLGLVPRLGIMSDGEQGWFRRLHLQSVANLLALRSLESRFYIGLLTPFLPCGLLYSMFLRAAAAGSATGGALTMLLFGAGIVPALVVTGLVSAYVGVRLRYYATKLAAVTVLLMGITMIMRGTGVPFPFGDHAAHRVSTEQHVPEHMEHGH
ncbi:MAG: sulfite exporter TauE/SafE family protein [Bacteroidota bacterium]